MWSPKESENSFSSEEEFTGYFDDFSKNELNANKAIIQASIRYRSTRKKQVIVLQEWFNMFL